jgi:prepilin peptidase CpaA
MSSPLVLWPTVIVALAATVTDLRSRRIPNLLVLPFLLLGVAVSAVMNGRTGLVHSALGIVMAVVVMGAFYALGGMGLGDVKLCAAIGAWIGPAQLYVALVATGLAGGAMALCWALAGGFLSETLRSTAGLIFGLGRNGLRPHESLVLSNPKTRKMPYAPAIAIGTIISFFGRHA